MLKRYRAAAMNGVSVQEFTERLLPILSKEIEVNHSDSEDPDKDKENSTKDTKQSPEAKRKMDWGKYIPVLTCIPLFKYSNLSIPTPGIGGHPSFCTEVEESESEDYKKVAVSFTCPHCLQEFDFSYPQTAKASFAHHTKKCGQQTGEV